MSQELTPPLSASRPSREEAEAAIVTLIKWIGEDPAREGLKETPRRVVKAFEEYFSGYNITPEQILSKSFSEDMGGYNEPVLIRDIEVESRCEHHMAPFIGRAHVAYIPDGRILGLSKIARVVDMYAHRMQVQERLTSEIALAIEKYARPKGVAVFIEAEHFCMKVRGAHQGHSETVTTRFLGAYKTDEALRSQFFASIRK